MLNVQPLSKLFIKYHSLCIIFKTYFFKITIQIFKYI